MQLGVVSAAPRARFHHCLFPSPARAHTRHVQTRVQMFGFTEETANIFLGEDPPVAPAPHPSDLNMKLTSLSHLHTVRGSDRSQVEVWGPQTSVPHVWNASFKLLRGDIWSELKGSCCVPTPDENQHLSRSIFILEM